MYSVGYQLMQARQARNLSIEDVAFETRIPHQRLRDMENDDLSNFANLTYAKGFLKLYSRFLALDLSDYLDEFDTSAISDVTGQEYLQATSATRRLSTPALAPYQARFSGNRLGAGALALFLIGGGWIFLQSRKHAAPMAGPPAARAILPGPVPPVVVVSASSDAPPPDSPAAAKATVVLPGESESTATATPSPTDPNATVPSPAVRRAMVVDDNGNEIPVARNAPR